MEVKIKAIHFDINDSLVAFINKKIDKLSRRFEAITEVEVSLKVVKPETSHNKEAGVKMLVPPANDLFASKTADSFEEAIDLCLDALEKPLEKVKETRK
ncbi:MAG: ribosome-associated translation inhibitor RaiA [Muribaculaceae bacterium]|nr:ribosome-associated translation inhibitor RaiA [Muribaculaceae bacterium]